MNKTTVINLFGSPGVGKSTLQAELYTSMKKAGYKVEMVREVAKKWAWNETPITELDQVNIIGEQIKNESELYGKVDYIITDSPIMLGAFYMDFNHGQFYMTDMVTHFMCNAEKNGVLFKNMLLSRKGTKYKKEGRFENIAQLENLDACLKSFLSWHDTNQIEGHPDHRLETINNILFKGARP